MIWTWRFGSCCRVGAEHLVGRLHERILDLRFLKSQLGIGVEDIPLGLMAVPLIECALLLGRSPLNIPAHTPDMDRT